MASRLRDPRTAGIQLLFLIGLLSGCARPDGVVSGADRLIREGWERATGLAAVPVGVITNHTGRLSDGTPLVDALLAAGIPVAAIFTPEHGFTGEAAEGARVYSEGETYHGVPIHSLYGTDTRPTDAMMEGIGTLLFDIQDVGARFYTYTSTLARTMEAAAEHRMPYVVLDRPDPIGGVRVEGPILDPALASFVGLFEVPVRYGLTPGEYAGWMVGTGAVPEVDLHVVAMEGWRRGMFYEETGLPWTAPSPNMPTPATAVVYPGTCLIEGTTVSEGRGTDHPFEWIGAPWADADRAALMLEALELPGVRFHPVVFTPGDTSTSVEVKWKGRECQGVRLEVFDREAFDPFLTGLTVVSVFHDGWPDDFDWRASHFDRLAGVSWLREGIEAGIPPRELAVRWQVETASWAERAVAYHLYPR